MQSLLALTLLMGGVVSAADPPPPAVKLPAALAVPVVIIPDGPSVQPVPTPNAALPFAANQTYIIQSSAPIIIRGLPKGLVSISLDQQAAGESIKLKAFLIVAPTKPGGNDGLDGSKFVTKTFNDACVYSITAVGTGICTLTVITGTDDSTDVIRVLNVGGVPIPPTPPTPPTPPSPVDPLTATLQDAFRSEPDASKSTKTAYLASVLMKMTTASPFPTTAGVLNAAYEATLHDTSLGGYAKGDMPTFTAAVDAELIAFFGKDPTKAIDPAASIAELKRLSAIIGGLKR